MPAYRLSVVGDLLYLAACKCYLGRTFINGCKFTGIIILVLFKTMRQPFKTRFSETEFIIKSRYIDNNKLRNSISGIRLLKA